MQLVLDLHCFMSWCLGTLEVDKLENNLGEIVEY